MKTFWGKLVAVVLCIALGWTGNNIYHGFKLKPILDNIEHLKTAWNLKETELEQVRQQANDEINTLRGMVTSASTIIAGLEEERDALAETAEAQTEEIRQLRTAEVEELMARYPALRAYDLAKDRLIETKDKIIFTLEARDAERVKIIEAQEKQILLEREIGLSWKTQFEGQQALRIALEGAFAHYRQSRLGSKLLYLAGGAAAGFLGGVIAH